MRSVILAVVAFGALASLAGCPIRSADEAVGGGDGDDEPGFGNTPNDSCARDSDCELAAATCCECPTFATSVVDPSNRACTGVACPSPPICAGNVRAACDLETSTCAIACVATACEASCPDGFAIDAATGCLSCACASPVDGCSLDADCVQTREDCCGCANGGTDTAVLDSRLGSHEQDLMCQTNPVCPGTNVCDPASEPRCVQGSCVLTSAVLPPNACGRSDLPGCPQGTHCALNADPHASELGVGVCVP